MARDVDILNVLDDMVSEHKDEPLVLTRAQADALIRVLEHADSLGRMHREPITNYLQLTYRGKLITVLDSPGDRLRAAVKAVRDA